MEKRYVLVSMDNKSCASTVIGVYSSREMAVNAMVYWIFEDKEKAEYYTEADEAGNEQFITDSTIWTIEEFEVDMII